MTDGARQMTSLSRQQALGKLASVPYGRVGFTHHALPAIRPVNHIVDGGQVIIRSHDGAAIVDLPSRGRVRVAAYEADQIDPATGTGWTVTITGPVYLITDPQQADRYRQILHPWVADEVNHVLRIDPQIISGCELTARSTASTTR